MSRPEKIIIEKRPGDNYRIVCVDEISNSANSLDIGENGYKALAEHFKTGLMEISYDDLRINLHNPILNQPSKTEDCIIESAFILENGTPIIIGSSFQYGITTYSCDENWNPIEYLCQGSPLIGFDSYTDFHKHMRQLHGEEKLIVERSSKLNW